MTSIKDLCDVLGYDLLNGLYVYDNESEVTNNKLNKLFSNNNSTPDSVFFIGEKPFIAFYQDPLKKAELFKTIWNINEIPVIILIENGAITIYNGFNYLKEEASLSVLGGHEALSDFEYFKIVTGKTWEKYENEFSYRNRVDYKLLENIKLARSILIDRCGLNNYSANALLGKAIFTRYLIDRRVRIGFNFTQAEWTTNDFCSILSDFTVTLDFFRYLEDKFKGNLFEIDDPQNSLNQGALNVIIELLSGSHLANNQLSLFDIYDFSIIPVEFISNVYETFIGEKEQAISGAYYTPLFLVDYITSQTVTKFFNLNPLKTSCKILDPACGSGIFLVETLRAVIEKYNNDNPDISRGSEIYRKTLTILAQQNIFGIDKDKSALSVAIFSIYLTLLDYQSPSDIENFEFPALLNQNFFIGDFFDEEKSFNSIFRAIEFDFILGNPPWKRGGGKEKVLEPYETYIKSRKAKEVEKNIKVSISNKEIAQAFLLRTSDFCQPNTVVSFIVTSKTLYNLNAREFRSYFFNNFFIDRIFELAPVRREVFDKSNDPAIAPAAILFYRYANNIKTGENAVEHFSIKPNRFFSLFKLFLIQRNDVKSVRQSLLKEYDWALKVLLYGNFNDFYFIKRLKEQYSILSVEASNRGCLIGQGAILNGNRELQDCSFMIGKPFIRTKQDIESFNIEVDENRVWTEPLALYPRDPKLYKAPQLLITEGISTEFRGVSAVNYDIDLVFKSSLTAVQSIDINFLENACGFLNSSLFSYYALITTSSAGVEREQTHDKEKLGFPFTNSKSVANQVRQLHTSKLEYNKAKKEIMYSKKDEIAKKISLELAKLDDLVFDSFELSDTEKALVDYATKYSIPSIIKSKSKKIKSENLNFKDGLLESYIFPFTDKFSKTFNSVGKGFSVEVWYSSHLIGLIFNIEDKVQAISEINWINKGDSEIIRTLVKLGHSKITDSFFVQKDVRGFGQNSFYIFKPNERKVWHKAMAYLDLNDFVDAILKAGGSDE